MSGVSSPGAESGEGGSVSKADVIAALAGSAMAADPPSPGLSGSIADGKANGPGIDAQRLSEAVVELAKILDPEACDVVGSLPIREAAETLHRQDVAIRSAHLAILAGYRRVVEDDTTLERIARALAEHDGYVWGGDPTDESVAHANEFYFVKRARAAVRAVREAGS